MNLHSMRNCRNGWNKIRSRARWQTIPATSAVYLYVQQSDRIIKICPQLPTSLKNKSGTLVSHSVYSLKTTKLPQHVTLAESNVQHMHKYKNCEINTNKPYIHPLMYRVAQNKLSGGVFYFEPPCRCN